MSLLNEITIIVGLIPMDVIPFNIDDKFSIIVTLYKAINLCCRTKILISEPFIMFSWRQHE